MPQPSTTRRVTRTGEPCRVFDSTADRGHTFVTGETREVSAELARDLLFHSEGWTESVELLTTPTEE